MFTNLQSTTFSQLGIGQEPHVHVHQIAGRLFAQAYGLGIRNRLLAKLFGKTNELQTLSRRPTTTRRSNRIITVAISKIVGSESRSDDFDAEFNPLKEHNRERWIGIAVARQRGVVLPAVELVQAGNQYYIRDGHHRISVAKALGQLDIEAYIVN